MKGKSMHEKIRIALVPEKIPFEQRPKESEKGRYVMISGESPRQREQSVQKENQDPSFVFRGALYDSSHHEALTTM